ncbi:RNA polymerase sigma factor [Telmatobacter sp. DSM 110680]|uniref:RNA polymerase sigma factor n=1 Tax=Telmatobacter sp. DSM 110680 TaxID=3036704 RepID=A0AAU7DMH5_9BACT
MTTDPDAKFTALVHRQSRFVFRVAYAVLLNSHDAEDAVQETFLKLYRNRGWERAENERAYLARVAWREAIDLRPRRSQLPVAGPEPLEADEAPSLQPGPEQALLSASEDSMIHAMIDALPEELRVPLALSAFEELHSPEIGTILGIPEGTVRTRLQRARQILRQKLTSLQESRYA